MCKNFSSFNYIQIYISKVLSGWRYKLHNIYIYLLLDAYIIFHPLLEREREKKIIEKRWNTTPHQLFSNTIFPVDTERTHTHDIIIMKMREIHRVLLSKIFGFSNCMHVFWGGRVWSGMAVVGKIERNEKWIMNKWTNYVIIAMYSLSRNGAECVNNCVIFYLHTRTRWEERRKKEKKIEQKTKFLSSMWYHTLLFAVCIRLYVFLHSSVVFSGKKNYEFRSQSRFDFSLATEKYFCRCISHLTEYWWDSIAFRPFAYLNELQLLFLFRLNGSITW